MTLQPIIFVLLFVYIFGGAVVRLDATTTCSTCCRRSWCRRSLFSSMSIGVNLNTDIKKGVFDRFRSLPIARSAPLIGAVLGDVVRYVVSIVVLMGFGYLLGFRDRHQPAVRAGRLPAGHVLRAVPELGVVSASA